MTYAKKSIISHYLRRQRSIISDEISLSSDNSCDLQIDLHILVVEDSLAQSKLIVQRIHGVASLFNAAWQIKVCHDADSALRAIDSETYTFDLVFVDQNLGFLGMRGDELISVMRKNIYMSHSVIIVCAANCDECCTKVTVAGADCVWQKPLPDVEQMSQRLTRLNFISKKRLHSSYGYQSKKVETCTNIKGLPMSGSVSTTSSIEASKFESDLVVHVLLIDPIESERTRIVAKLKRVSLALKQHWNICDIKDEAEAIIRLQNSSFSYNLVIIGSELNISIIPQLRGISASKKCKTVFLAVPSVLICPSHFVGVDMIWSKTLDEDTLTLKSQIERLNYLGKRSVVNKQVACLSRNSSSVNLSRNTSSVCLSTYCWTE